MLLRRITVENYRNIASAELYPSEQLTVLYGLNGQGKTNLLEAIYLLGSGRSFRYAKVPDLIRNGLTQAIVTGQVQVAGITNEIKIDLEGKHRRVRVDGKSIQRAADLHGKLAAVMFSPDDTFMVKLGPDQRRRFLDRALYTQNALFLREYHDYHRALKHRNAVLRSGSQAALEIWNDQLAEYGCRLMESRNRYVQKLGPLLQKHYAWISGGQEQVAVSYRMDVEPDNFLKELCRCQPSDLRMGTTGRGPHRDDLNFLIDGRPLKIYGSQGQQRSFVLALKLAELDTLQQTFHEPPLMLLDDVASELDRKRISNLFDFLHTQHVQVLITTTTLAGIDPDLLRQSRCYRVEAGTLTYEGSVPR